MKHDRERSFGCPLIKALIAVAAMLCSQAAAAPVTPAEYVASEAFGGGLIVYVAESGTADTLLQLGKRKNPLVLGLYRDSKTVEQLRVRIRAAGQYGRITVARMAGERLPLANDLANLLIVEAPCSIPDGELMRVICPNGLLLRGRDESWRSERKPRPPELDEWTHFLHGPDGHVMSNDLRVGPPYHIQWIGTPVHSKSHVHLTTVNVMVSGGGRLFYIVDESIAALPDSLPSRWALVARDAFNGIELWRRPLSSWQPYHVKDRNSYPADVHRRLVAGGDVVFVTLSIHGPVSALDAATGRTLRTYADTDQAEDIVHENGILYLSVNTGEREQIDRRAMAYRHVEPQQKRVMAIGAETGDLLWDKTDEDTHGLMPVTLAVKNDHLYFQNPDNVVCLAKATGRVIWKSARPSDYFRPGWSSPTLVAFEDVVVSADRQSGPGQRLGKDKYAAGGFSTGNIVVFSAKDGKRLWSAPCAEGCRAPTDVFGIGNRLWFGKSLERRVHEYRQVHDLHTGKVLKELPADRKWPSQHHHRCYRDKSTRRYILAGRTGVEFIDLESGEVKLHTWLRGNCKFGVLPCNGLLYAPPDQCGCYVESKLTGFHALAPKRPEALARPDAHPLERGPAYADGKAAGTDEPAAGDWPTFRSDNARTGRADTRVPAKLQQAWRARLGGRLTQPVVANGLVFVASVDSHTLHALDANSGERVWEFIAGGRIDSPPTVARGLVVFGCRDGWVYALRRRDGQLAWRSRAAPDGSRIIDNGQLESVWPVHGSVLVNDGAVYYAAGRSSYVDGGMRMGKLDLATGKPLLRKTFYSRDPETGEAVRLYEPFPAKGRLLTMEMPGVLPDVLSSDGERIWMRAVTFDPGLNIRQEFPDHLFCSMGFLDDSWWELTYWIYGRHMFSGRAGIAHAIGMYPTARLMVCGSEEVYGCQEGYESIKKAAFVATSKKPESKEIKAGRKKRRQIIHRWSVDVPLHVNGLVLAGDSLCMAGPPAVDTEQTSKLMATLTTDDYDWEGVLAEAAAGFSGEKGGLFVILSRNDGAKLMEMKLDSIPVFDGLIAACGRIYMSMKDGSLVCLKQQ